LGEQGKKTYVRLRDYYKTMNAVKQHLLEKQLERLDLPEEQKNKLMASIRLTFEKDAIDPFFPLSRFGDFVLEVGKRGSHESYRFDTFEERNRAANEYAAQKGRSVNELKQDGELRTSEDSGGATLRNSIESTSKLLKTAYEAIDSASMGNRYSPDLSFKQELKDSLYQAYLAAMPEGSVRKMFIHRKGTPGFSSDVLRSVERSGVSMSRAFAKLEHAGDIRSALDLANRQLEGNDKYKAFVRRMEELAAETLQPRVQTDSEKWFSNGANYLAKIAFIRNLTSWSSAIMQPLDIIAKGLPVMFAYHGAKGVAEMSRMLKFWNRYGVIELQADGTKRFRAPSIEFAKGLSALERRAVRDMVDIHGVTKNTYVGEVFNREKAPATVVKSKAREFAGDVVNGFVFGGLMHHAERLSREVMALSFFNVNMAELQKAHPNRTELNYHEAIKRALKETNQVLGNYDVNNKPLIMRGGMGKIVSTYKFFPYITTKLLIGNFYKALPLAGHQEKAKAANAFFGVLGMHALMYGIVGLPAYSLIMKAIQAAWEKWQKDPDAPEDMRSVSWEEWFHTVKLPQMLGNVDLARLAQYGILNAATGNDFSSRGSLNDMWFRSPLPGKTPTETALNWGQVIAGPIASTALTAVQGVDLLTQGEYERGMEKLTPAAISKLMIANRYKEQGVQNPKGEQLVMPGKIPMNELIGQAVGFTPARVKEAQDRAFHAVQAEKVIDRQRSQIMNTIQSSWRKSTDSARSPDERKRFGEIFSDSLKKATEFSIHNPEKAIHDADISQVINVNAKRIAETEMGGGVKVTNKNFELVSPSSEAANKALEKYRK